MIDQETLDIFEKIYNDTFNDVSKYIVCHCSDMEDVNDIIQNVYCDVLRNIHRRDVLNKKAYIMKITRNKLKDYYRFRYRSKFITLISNKDDLNFFDNYADDIDIEKSAMMKFDVDLVWDYLKSKNIIIFKIFYLYYSLELTIKEISLELNISESNVKNYLYRTLKELKYLYEREGDKDV